MLTFTTNLLCQFALQLAPPPTLSLVLSAFADTVATLAQAVLLEGCWTAAQLAGDRKADAMYLQITKRLFRVQIRMRIRVRESAKLSISAANGQVYRAAVPAAAGPETCAPRAKKKKKELGFYEGFVRDCESSGHLLGTQRGNVASARVVFSSDGLLIKRLPSLISRTPSASGQAATVTGNW